MKGIYNNFYLSSLFFKIFGGITALFAISFVLPMLFPIAQTLLVLGTALVVVDYLVVFNKGVKFSAERTIPKVLSLGYEHQIHIKLKNEGNTTLNINTIDELPFQLQKRDFSFSTQLKPKQGKQAEYKIRALVRGSYLFGDIILFLNSKLNLVVRRYPIAQETTVPVYPSILDMKKLELITLSKVAINEGIKRIRRIGHSHEFEQIKNYTAGDDFQKINWKASSKGMGLMVNHYEDEKSQQIYSVIDKSRSMKMPFNGLSLLDYSINSSLVISNTALKKMDRAGLFTFSEKVDTVIKAQRNQTQLKRIIDALYNEKEGIAEANYELMYRYLRKSISGRSLLFLYTNFESKYALQRVLPIIRQLNKLHLLVVVIFQNTELINYSKEHSSNVEEVYFNTIADKLIYDKKEIVQEMTQFGIQTILTHPENLSINVINKYLELKSRGLI
ncbi:MAG: DUF58 domain-containing protein [Flammeovirgaceae bacterium]|nr:DUF58 domain-containing protein [Flammeovirgaceae bacterium]